MSENLTVKTIDTRIALKYDSYANWIKTDKEDEGGNLKLLVGEIGICEIPAVNGDSRVAPTVLFKVGAYKKDSNGNDTTELTPFKDLPWASAKAADVYGWAKAANVKITTTTNSSGFSTKTLDFVAADDSVVKSITLDYLTAEEVTTITEGLTSRIAALETTINGVTGGAAGLTTSIEDLTDRIEVIEGADTVEGSVAKALKDAKAHAETKASAALADAKTYADGKAATNEDLIDGVDAKITAHTTTANPHGITADTIGLGNVDNKSVAEIKTDFTGTVASGSAGFATGGAVYLAIDAAKTAAATDAQGKVDALANGQVKDNTDAIAANTAAIAEAKSNYEAADEALGERLDRVERFFDGAQEDSTALNDALDTLKEIQDFINTTEEDGEVTAKSIVTSINNNTEAINGHSAAIESLQSIVNLESGTGGLKKTLEDMKTNIADNTADIETLQGIVGTGFTSTDTIAKAITAAQTTANTGVENAGKAQADASDALRRVGAIEALSLADVINTVNQNKADIAELETLTSDYSTVKETVNTLQSIVVSGTNSNQALRDDLGVVEGKVTTIETLVTDAAKGNNALATQIKTVSDAVNHATTGLSAAHGKIATIESDYLRAADFLILQCGTSSTNNATA
jgi:chromosome segregation ATPase